MQREPRRIPYGPAAEQFGDLRLPDGPGPHPVAVLVHGGFWRARYDLVHLEQLCAALARSGFATWNLEYRRAGQPGGGWPGTFHDIAAGVRALGTLEEREQLDLARVALVGFSAGGHLAVWLAGSRRLPPDHPLRAGDVPSVSGVVSLAGVLDLAGAHTLGLSEGAAAEFLGATPAEAKDRWSAASPLDSLPQGLPVVLVHGAEDEIVPLALSRTYYDAARQAGDPVELVSPEATGHFELIDPGSSAWPAVLAAVQRAAGVTGSEARGRI